LSQANPSSSGAPWWRHGHVWLVIAGPSVVVAAGFVTLWLAIRTPDPVVAEDYYRRGMAMSQEKRLPAEGLAPAQQARNHAATPVSPGAGRR
jgi:uncharacterized protein